MNELKLVEEPIFKEDEHGRLVLSESVESNIDLIEQAKSIVDAAESAFRTDLLNAMIEQDILSAKAGKYTISVAKGKNTVTFNSDEFVKNESDDMILAFCQFNETKTFNMERFKEEHPELFEQYCDVNTEVIVDVKKLQKTMPNVYEKYASEIVSDKKPVLKIAKSRSKE